MSDQEYLSWLCLFPGPLRILCQDQNVKTVTELRHILHESPYANGVLDYLISWYTAWQTRGRFIRCTLNYHQLEWVGWDVAQVTEFTTLFWICVDKNLWDLLEWCYQCQPRKLRVDANTIHRCICAGHLGAFQWLHQKGYPMKRVSQWWEYSCCQNYLELAQWFYYTFSLVIQQYHLKTMYVRCAKSHGDVKMVQWLRGLIHTPTPNVDYDAFCAACYRNQLSVAQWIYSFGQVDLLKYQAHVLVTNAQYGHLEIVRWMMSLNVFSPTHVEAAFVGSCDYNKHKMAQMLHELSPMNRSVIHRALAKIQESLCLHQNFIHQFSLNHKNLTQEQQQYIKTIEWLSSQLA